jgi:hypothetical protein
MYTCPMVTIGIPPVPYVGGTATGIKPLDGKVSGMMTGLTKERTFDGHLELI